MQIVRSALRNVSSLARLAGAGALAALLLCALPSAASAKHKVPQQKVEIVRQGELPAKATWPAHVEYFNGIQEAVNATEANADDWVLIEPGVYDEEVKVTKKHSGIFIRGLNRNTVILDGQHKVVKPRGRNGIEVRKADNVWIENLTVRNFERAKLNGKNGNEIWWNGGADSGKIGATGWYGRYLTAYDTGLNGGYGIFTGNEQHGEWENIYASGFNDSGIYIGACQECEARVNKATMEYNALGYSGSNSGGNLVIEHSIFRHNTSGIAPNSENPGDGPPPDNGQCPGPTRTPPMQPVKEGSHVNWTGELPEFHSTEIERCEIFRYNLVAENNDLEAPANTSSADAPWGVGIELPGDYATLTEHNEIIDNPTDGVLAFEYPNPYPPGSVKHVDTIDFQNAGNEVTDNTFEGNGSYGGAYSGAIMFEGGVFGTKTSTDNCISANTYVDHEATYPADIEGTWGCQNATTPNPVGIEALLYIETLSEESKHREKTAPVGEPPPQETMPHPCEGVPANPACEALGE